MLFKYAIYLIALATAVASLEQRAEAAAPVLTAKRVFQTVIDESPFIVKKTTTITWIQSPSVSASASAA
ncbi:hypothetical protein HGRIS_003385 [Hohenbuehelia grisea]|uniref:Uncharacterized protein n=1 Tax=Hohenbuehelia grisea TaxID=104357 RepID=A0ABR3JGS9_9AGAR